MGGSCLSSIEILGVEEIWEIDSRGSVAPFRWDL
jgi:hypothetical protein